MSKKMTLVLCTFVILTFGATKPAQALFDSPLTGAAGGALIGGIAGGGSGAAIGAVAGGVVGAAVQDNKRRQQEEAYRQRQYDQRPPPR